MILDDILREVRATPFRPFVLHLTSGRNVVVRSPEFFARSGSGRSITVYGERDDREVIDTAQIASIVSDGASTDDAGRDAA